MLKNIDDAIRELEELILNRHDLEASDFAPLEEFLFQLKLKESNKG